MTVTPSAATGSMGMPRCEVKVSGGSGRPTRSCTRCASRDLGPVRSRSPRRRAARLGARARRKAAEAVQAGPAQQHIYRTVPDNDPAAKAKLGVHPAAAVGAARTVMHAADQVGQPHVSNRACRRGPAAPGVEPGLRHAQHPTGHLHRQSFAGYHCGRLELPFGRTSPRSSSVARRCALSSVSNSLPPPGRHQLGLLRTGQPRHQAAIDPILAPHM
jgi:hypothetical protein